MGILDSIKRRLPILGTPAPRPTVPLHIRPSPRPAEPEEAGSPRGDRPVPEFVAELIKAHKVVLFMKGTPDSPSCGFSASASSILRGYGQPFHTFDVLVDGDVREGVKQFSSWPTLPQVFINGEFVGGSDILKQLHESGDLKTMLG